MPSFKVISSELHVRTLPDKDSTSLGRLKQGAIVEKLGESGKWFFIRLSLETDNFYGDIVGWASSKDPQGEVLLSPAESPAEPGPVIDDGGQVVPDEPFSVDSNLKERPSPLTAALIETYCSEKGKPGLAGIGEPVMAAAKKYSINATYIVAHAIHESGWGTSKMSQEKHNLFGFQAYDSNTGMARTFDTFDDCIDYVMNYVNTNYLTKAGKYFEGKPCLGDKDKGYGMNVNYATDPHWAQAIADHAQNLENWVKKSVQPTPDTPKVNLDAKHILDAVAQVNPEQAYYRPHDITSDGSPETFCNWFVADTLKLLGIQLPCYDDAPPCYPPIFPEGRCHPKLATDLNIYFNNGGDGHWSEVGREEAVSLTNQGKIVVVSMPGHIGLVIPGGHDSEVHIAQAGRVCRKDMLLEQGFGHADVQFFEYKE